MNTFKSKKLSEFLTVELTPDGAILTNTSAKIELFITIEEFEALAEYLGEVAEEMRAKDEA